MSPISLWEAHKCVIQGKLIGLATKAKKQHQETINTLIVKIKHLEISHKQSHAQSTLQDLLSARSLLLEEYTLEDAISEVKKSSMSMATKAGDF